MPIITVVPVESELGTEVDVTLPDGSTHRQWIRSAAVSSGAAADMTPWVIDLLPLAMRLNATLRVEGPVDRVLLDNSDHVQSLFRSWYPEFMGSASIEPQGTHEGTPSKKRAAFFSGGVDSFYTLATAGHLDGIIFVGGFDIALARPAKIEAAAVAARAAAAEFGIAALEVSTNIKTLTDYRVPWGTEQHGAALAAVAYSLRSEAGGVSIASSYMTEQLHPWGTHPDLDPLWSSSVQTIAHDTTTSTRAEKIAVAMQYSSAREGLRVCWRDVDEYNCGVCEKCVRTQVNLRATGNDGKCRTLPTLDVGRIRKQTLWMHGERLFAEENLSYLRREGIDDSELEHALESAIRKGERWEPVLSALYGSAMKVPGLPSVVRKVKALIR